MHLWGLVTRRAFDENENLILPHPWVAEHQITVDQALRMLTYEGAYAVKQEDYIGSLEVGKFADLILISEDPYVVNPNDLWEIQVLYTMVGGHTEYKADSLILPLEQAGDWSTSNILGYELLLVFGALMSLIIVKKSQKWA